METVLHLSLAVDHATDEAPERVLRESFAEIRDSLDPRALSPNARRLLEALEEAVDDAEEA